MTSAEIMATGVKSAPAETDHSALRGIGNIAAVLAVALYLSGCAVGKSVDKLADDGGLTTGSIPQSVVVEDVDPGDAEQIKLAVADAGDTVSDSNLLAWSNPETGNSGTITAIDEYIGTSGQSCKKFRTTVDSFMGISLYEGETCELKKGFWVLSWFMRDKSS